ncbi:MAG: ribonuclease P protein component [Candidatus Marinimicrobia bacterium]|nr:ribonuclease P protein component [Candidatus Neomarinimicrobiota bacterium]
MNAGLKKSEILSDKKEISRLFEKGKWSKGTYINVVSLPAKERRILFAVARHIKGAVHRNRGKRYLREVYRTNKEYFSPLCVYGIILKKFPVKKPLQLLLSDIRSIIQYE